MVADAVQIVYLKVYSTFCMNYLLSVATLFRVAVPCTGSLILLVQLRCTVPISLAIAWTLLGFKFCIHYSIAAHLTCDETESFCHVILVPKNIILKLNAQRHSNVLQLSAQLDCWCVRNGKMKVTDGSEHMAISGWDSTDLLLHLPQIIWSRAQKTLRMCQGKQAQKVEQKMPGLMIQNWKSKKRN